MKKVIIALAIVVVVVIALIIGTMSGNTSGKKVGHKENLLGAGSTFAYPIYTKMFNTYYKLTGIKVNYQAIGSGAGINQIKNKTVDFGASDAFLSNKDMKNFSNPVVHIATCAGAVVMTYNIPGVDKQLKFTPEIVSGIYLGQIKNWDSKLIAQVNPNVKLPNLPITVVHRSDGSGTTFIFSRYLSKVNNTWSKEVGTGKALSWPVGLGGKGNPGVAGIVKQTPGAIGYVELIYAFQTKMPYAKLKNKSGNFIQPTLKSVASAANIELPDDMRVSLTNTSAEDGYPISGFTWIIVYKDLKNGNHSKVKAEEIAKLIYWMIHDGQKYCEKMQYAPLSKKAVAKDDAILKTLTYNGTPLLKNI